MLDDSFIIQNIPVEKNFGMSSYDCESSLSNKGSNIVDKPEDEIYQIREMSLIQSMIAMDPAKDTNSS